MSTEIPSAQKAIQIAKDYAKHSMAVAYWKDVISCNLNRETENWEIVFEASPTILSPYNRYYLEINSKTGYITKAKKLE